MTPSASVIITASGKTSADHRAGVVMLAAYARPRERL
jgi:hypothetical protein